MRPIDASKVQSQPVQRGIGDDWGKDSVQILIPAKSLALFGMTDTFERLFQTIARIIRASDGSPRQSLVGNVGAPKGIFEVAANHSNHRRPFHRSITLYSLKEFCFQILKTLFQASSAHKQRRS